jgi:hypothetical protein
MLFTRKSIYISHKFNHSPAQGLPNKKNAALYVSCVRIYCIPLTIYKDLTHKRYFGAPTVH